MPLHLSIEEVRDLNEAGLLTFLDKQIPEGMNMDYKQMLSGKGKTIKKRKQSAYVEFLKDITAFSNAYGGLIIIGAKEPEEGLSTQEQLVGLPDGQGLESAIGTKTGEKLARDLERLSANSVDPPIPGLLIVPIPIKNKKSAIVVRIPPSFGRPHMVSYNEYRLFYIRHSESSMPMTTHEVRECVLSSATAADIARNYLEKQEKDVLQYDVEGPCFLIQSMPLLPLEQPWDVYSSDFASVIQGTERQKRYRHAYFDLASIDHPRLTILGIRGKPGYSDPKWLTEVHRNGYCHVLYHPIPTPRQGGSYIELNKNYKMLFSSFCDMARELWDISRTELPYVFRCKFLTAKGLYLATYSGHSEPYKRNEILWPEQLTQAGESIDKVHREWFEHLYYAFGERPPEN